MRLTALVWALATADPRAPYSLTLDDALARALARNYTLAIERESLAGAVERVRREEAAYDLQLGLDGGYGKRTEPVNSLLSGAPLGRVAPDLRTLDFGVSISRSIRTGGSLSLLADGTRARSNGTFSLLSPAYGTSFGFELRQPLLRDRAIDPVRRRIRVARSESSRSLAGLKRAIAETVAGVDTAYWGLTAAQGDVEVRAAAVTLAEQQLAETRLRIGAGILPDNEEAQPRAELERRRGELLTAQEQAVRAENALKAFILDEGGDPLWGLRLVPSDRAETESGRLDLAATLDAAALSRPEIEEAEAGLASQAIEVQAARDERKPRLDAFAAYTRRGLAGGLNAAAGPIFGQPVVVPRDLDGGLGRSLGTVADGLYPDFRVGVSMSVPIGNRAARANVAIAEAEHRRAAADLARVRQAVRVEVRNAAAAVETTTERIAAARAAREAAEIQLRSEKERFAVGISTNFLVLTRQNELSRARLDQIQALSDHRKALTELQRASGRLLQDRGVVVAEEATGGHK